MSILQLLAAPSLGIFLGCPRSEGETALHGVLGGAFANLATSALSFVAVSVVGVLVFRLASSPRTATPRRVPLRQESTDPDE